MHKSVMSWVEAQVKKYELAGLSALEVGSLDVNGSPRTLFAGDYVGIDFREGPGVDRIVDGHNLVEVFGTAAFDVVVCTEMLEHDVAFWVSMQQMGAVLRPGGHLLVTTRGNGFKPHGYPYDYWRFMPEAREPLLALAGCTVVELGLDPQRPGIFMHGRRA
jgi:SAM-dependent methyltransferase